MGMAESEFDKGAGEMRRGDLVRMKRTLLERDLAPELNLPWANDEFDVAIEQGDYGFVVSEMSINDISLLAIEFEDAGFFWVTDDLVEMA
jgi:hypothetical protein